MQAFGFGRAIWSILSRAQKMDVHWTCKMKEHVFQRTCLLHNIYDDMLLALQRSSKKKSALASPPSQAPDKPGSRNQVSPVSLLALGNEMAIYPSFWYFLILKSSSIHIMTWFSPPFLTLTTQFHHLIPPIQPRPPSKRARPDHMGGMPRPIHFRLKGLNRVWWSNIGVHIFL